jgi:hypothetical protein
MPEQVQALSDEQKLNALFGRCTFYARGPNLPHPAILGSLIADSYINQMMRAMVAAQSKIVVPR